mgnify:CR=1 FL=1
MLKAIYTPIEVFVAIPNPQQSIRPNSLEARQTLSKALGRAQGRWLLSNKTMAALLHVAPNTYGLWINKEEVPAGGIPYRPETEAVIALLAIHRSLSAMFSNPQDQLLWLTTTHPSLQSKSPLQFAMSSLANLFQLRSYLDFVRGRGA